jgi:5-methylcytosine-specific restriction endonuclease McrA
MLRIRGNLRNAVTRRTGGICFYCGLLLDNRNFSIDHFISQSRMGSWDLENLVPACIKCNNDKGSRLPNEEEMQRFFSLPSTENDPIRKKQKRMRL